MHTISVPQYHREIAGFSYYSLRLNSGEQDTPCMSIDFRLVLIILLRTVHLIPPKERGDENVYRWPDTLAYIDISLLFETYTEQL